VSALPRSVDLACRDGIHNDLNICIASGSETVRDQINFSHGRGAVLFFAAARIADRPAERFLLIGENFKNEIFSRQN
jgi:hypothetical protein